MNKNFKICLLLLISSTYLFSQSFLKKIDNSPHKLSLDESYIDNVKKSLNNGEMFVSSTFYQIKNDMDIEVEFIVSNTISDMLISFNSSILLYSKKIKITNLGNP